MTPAASLWGQDLPIYAPTTEAFGCCSTLSARARFIWLWVWGPVLNSLMDICTCSGLNGSVFVVNFVDPYSSASVQGSEPAHVLAAIPPLSFAVLSLNWSSFYRQYLAVGQGIFKAANGTTFPAYVFSQLKSADLVPPKADPPATARPSSRWRHGQ
jgi:hypothetical protein